MHAAFCTEHRQHVTALTAKEADLEKLAFLYQVNLLEACNRLHCVAVPCQFACTMQHDRRMLCCYAMQYALQNAVLLSQVSLLAAYDMAGELCVVLL